jgi:trigger factor
VKVTLWPELRQTPNHSGRLVEVGSLEVSDEEIAEQIDRIRDQFASLEPADRPADTGDFVTVDISATLSGEPVPEANAEQLLYEIGSGGFIEGIDDQLIGAAAGDTRVFDGELPQGFGELTGVPVHFSVAVRDVRRKVLPELTDEWVAEITEFASTAELEVNLEERMTAMKRRSLAAQFRERALGQLVDEVFVDLPEAIVRSEMDEVLHRFVHRLERQGITLDDYFSVANTGREEFVDDLRSQAEQSLKTRLLLEAVAKEAGVEVSPEELSVAVEAIALQSDKPDSIRKALRQGPQEKSLVGDILRNKALALIVEGATPVDEAGNPVDLDVEEGGASADGDEVVPAGVPMDEAEGGLIEAGIVETGIVETGIVEAEIVEAEVVADMDSVAGDVDGTEEE